MLDQNKRVLSVFEWFSGIDQFFRFRADPVDGAELAEVASLAKAYCSDAYFQCAAECLQIHGGVGFTWEYDCHLYFKRAKAIEVTYGNPTYQRERVATLLNL